MYILKIKLSRKDYNFKPSYRNKDGIVSGQVYCKEELNFVCSLREMCHNESCKQDSISSVIDFCIICNFGLNVTIVQTAECD
jgi:hypothetical protein